jgi:GNAT superfamily N-acetyltransferase
VKVSTDPGLLDIERLHRWLSEDAYWALGRTREVVERSVEHSINFGVYDDSGEQVAYARVVTDQATFAWLCDVYVSPGHRGAGIGTTLLDAVDAHLAGLRLSRILLATADAHALYERYGFRPLPEPDRFMALGRPGE